MQIAHWPVLFRGSFPLLSDPSVSMVAWTTTPWTLPSNLGLCVNPTFTYVKIEDVKLKRVLILAKCRLGALYKKPAEYKVINELLGSTLVGEKYTPCLPYVPKPTTEVEHSANFGLLD